MRTRGVPNFPRKILYGTENSSGILNPLRYELVVVDVGGWSLRWRMTQ